MLLMTAQKHYQLKQHFDKNTDTGTCYKCKWQGEGLDYCKSCIRNELAITKIKDNFKKN